MTSTQQIEHGASMANFFQPSTGEVAAVRSHYEDELRPMGRILLRRLREREARRAAASAGVDAEGADVESLALIDRTCGGFARGAASCASHPQRARNARWSCSARRACSWTRAA